MQRLFLLLIAIGFCPWLSASAEDTVNRTADIKVTHQIAKDSVGGNVCTTMAGMGIDFPILLQRALDGEDRAIRLLIWAGEHAGLDGAASEGYSYAMIEAAKKIGDVRLAAAVKVLKMESFENTKMFFQFEFGSGNDEAAATAEIKKLFPTFWHLITKRVEQ